MVTTTKTNLLGTRVVVVRQKTHTSVEFVQICATCQCRFVDGDGVKINLVIIQSASITDMHQHNLPTRYTRKLQERLRVLRTIMARFDFWPSCELRVTVCGRGDVSGVCYQGGTNNLQSG